MHVTPRQVGEMFSSYEMAEWRAYEMAHGPVDGSWERETLAQMHELLQMNAYIAGAQAEENPVPPPRTKDRPGLAYGFERDQDGLYTVTPPEEVDEQREAQSDGGADALNAFFDSEEFKEG
jgi:hypothetical protein